VRYALDVLKYDPQRIILYGRSLGSGPAVHVAAKFAPHLGGLVLHSPLMSCIRVVLSGGCLYKTCLRPCDAFDNALLIDRVSMPTLVIHGALDDIVPFEHGEYLFHRCRSSVRPLWVSDAGHNDIEVVAGDQLIRRLRTFLEECRRSSLGGSASPPGSPSSSSPNAAGGGGRYVGRSLSGQHVKGSPSRAHPNAGDLQVQDF
jgi:fermentation-respiration switch protein FrsA (DUF1100 family)